MPLHAREFYLNKYLVMFCDLLPNDSVGVVMAQTTAKKSTDDSGEIDRIIQEIEEMEKGMDQSPAEAVSASAEETPDAAPEGVDLEGIVEDIPPEASEETNDDFEKLSNASTGANDGPAFNREKVVPLRAVPQLQEADLEAESPSTGSSAPGVNFDSIASNPSEGGGLALRVAGCTNIALEFTHNGLSVSLRLEEDVLAITTDNGAEFRIPIKRQAA